MPCTNYLNQMYLCRFLLLKHFKGTETLSVSMENKTVKDLVALGATVFTILLFFTGM